MGRAQDQIFWSSSNALCDFGKGTPLSGPRVFICGVRPGCRLRPSPALCLSPLFPFIVNPSGQGMA